MLTSSEYAALEMINEVGAEMWKKLLNKTLHEKMGVDEAIKQIESEAKEEFAIPSPHD